MSYFSKTQFCKIKEIYSDAHLSNNIIYIARDTMHIDIDKKLGYRFFNKKAEITSKNFDYIIKVLEHHKTQSQIYKNEI